MNPYPLLTERLILRAILPQDREAIYAIFSNPNVTRFYDVPTMKTMRAADRLISWWQQRISSGKALRWGIELKNGDQQLIGTCGFSELNLSQRTAEIGIDLNEKYWHQGFMKEALKAVINYGFKELYLNEIHTWIIKENRYSIAGIESLGFIHLGKVGERSWQGKQHDQIGFSLPFQGMDGREG